MVISFRGVGRGLIAAVLSISGCGSAGHTPGGGSGGGSASGGNGSGSGGATASGGSGGGGATASGGNGGGTAADCTQDLSGTWDLIAEGGGRGPRSGVMILSSTSLSLQFDATLLGPTLVYNVQPTQRADWQFGAGAAIHHITIATTPASLNSGAIPLALGGAWTFATGDEQCTATVAAALLKASCQGPSDYAGGSDWPFVVPNPNNGRMYTATRVSASASQFGDLGGQWKTSASGGDGGSCTVTFVGNQVTTHCAGIVPVNGTMQLTIGSDCVASGMTGDAASGFGFAISGRRR